MSSAQSYHVAIVGVTGAVGQAFLDVLEDRKFPIASIKFLASERSAGKEIEFAGNTYRIEAVSESSFDGVDFAFFSAGASVSKAYKEAALKAGAYMIDNSSAFRMDADTALVIPEVNFDKLSTYDNNKLIANPNCVAAIMVMALGPIAKLYNPSRVIVSSYQAASGAGAAAVAELKNQTQAILNEQEPVAEVMPHVFAFNLFVHESTIEADGYNGEERKVIDEVRKILSLPELPLTITSVRVPVIRAHSMSLTIDFDESVDMSKIEQALKEAKGVTWVSDEQASHFPMPIEASNQYDVLVGRLRRDLSKDNSIHLFISGDQLLKGAALNAVQIAEYLIGA